MSDETLKQDLNPEVKAEETKEPKAEDKKSDDTRYEEKIEELQAKLSKEGEEKGNLLKALQEERTKRQERKEDEPKAPPAVDEDRIATLISETTDKKFNEMRVDMALSVFEEELGNVSSNAKEKELIKMHYKTSIRPSGFDRDAIRKDLALSRAAANIDRVKFETDEGDVSLATAMSGSGGKVSNAVTEKLELSAQEQRLLDKFGVSKEEALKELGE